MRPEQKAPPEPGQTAPPLGLSPGDQVGPFEVTLTAALDAPAMARDAVSAWMAGHVGETMLADAQLVVVELVTNSVRHAEVPGDAVVRVRGRLRGGVLHLEVEDRGRSGLIAQRAPDLQHGGGFGLHLVERLSRRWGVERDAGTRVWAELAFPATG